MSQLTLYDLVGDLVIYRDLDPVDARLPRFADAWADRSGLADATRPRKRRGRATPVARPGVCAGRRLPGRPPPAGEIVYLGDTTLSDGNAFKNLRA